MSDIDHRADQNKAGDLVADALELPWEARQEFITSRAENDNISKIALRLLKSELLATSGLLATAGGLRSDMGQLSPGTHLGAWRVKGLLGQGGMGDVYAVERADGLYDQKAALKMISGASPHLWARFTKERQVLARLEHPHIARLIDGGVSQSDNRPYLVMERVNGVPIDAYASSYKLRQRDRLKLFLNLCDALSHAHRRLIIHRDIKPSNVLVTDSGQIKLLDFGVAGLIEDGVVQDHAPSTPVYAAPEQRDGNLATVATDIYGAGLTLYTVLTGEIPDQSDLTHNQIKRGSLNPELLAIINRSTNDDPYTRYDNIDDLADDIHAYLEKRPVKAFSDSRTYHFKRFIARNPLGTILAASLVAAIVAGLLSTTTFAVQANRALVAEREASAIALERADFADRTSETFARLTGQAIGAQDEGNLNISDILKNEAEDAAKNLNENPTGASASLLAIAQIHERRSDSAALLETTQYLYERDDLEASKASVLGLVMHGVYSGFGGDTETALAALAKVDQLLADDDLRGRYANEAVMASAYRAEFSGDPVAMRHAINMLVETARSDATKDDIFRGEAILRFNHAARLYNRLGEFEEALSLITEADSITESMTKPAPRVVEPLMTAKVVLNMRLGRTEDARRAADQSVDFAQLTYGPSVALAQRYESSGRLHLQTGDTKGALERFENAIAYFQRFETEPKVQMIETQLQALAAQAEMAEILSEPIEANLLFATVERMITEAPIHTPALALGMAKAHMALGNSHLAITWAERAETVALDQTRNDLVSEASALIDALKADTE